MGRKTKKEKIIADLRRKMAQLEVRSENSESGKEEKILAFKKNPFSSPPLLTTPPSVQSESIYIYPIQLIKKDLTKTIFLTILAISFEIILFLTFQGKIKLPTIKINLPISLNFI